MSELNINDLPSEILLTVFRYLDAADWKNATLTCKLWNSLIESGCRWILSLDKSCRRNKQKENFVLTTNRKFGTMTIRGYRISENNQPQTIQRLDRKFGTMTIRESHVSEISQLFKIIQRHGFNVVKLNLRSCNIRGLVAFAKFLNLTPNLEYVDMQSVQYIGKTNSLTDAALDHFLPDLKKLKTLKIIATNYWIVKFFQKAKLTTMRIEESLQSWRHGNLHSFGHLKAWLVDFLSSQDMLTLLIVICESRQSIAVDLGKSNVPVQFRLKQLAVFIEHDQSENFYYEIRNVLKFVQSQAQYLTELELSGSGMPLAIYKSVFTSMAKLDTLISGLEHIVYMDVSCIKHLPENCRVRNLQLNDAFWYSSHLASLAYDNASIFFKKLPNIQSLRLPEIVMLSDDVLAAMTDNLTKLESLFVYSIDKVPVRCMKFLNLKTLRIQRLSVRVNWSDFTKIHAQLTEIAIETIRPVSTFTSDDVDQIATNVDLQSIRLGAGFVADDRFFDVIRTKCKNVKMVELHKSCISHMEDSVQINALRLYDDINRSWYCHMWGDQEYEV